MYLQMPKLNDFERVSLLEGPTPIQRLTRLEQCVDGRCALFVKRDDLTGLGGGGNKLRKLEFLLGQARAEGKDTLITVGARQSNHARLTAASAAAVGFHAELVLTRTVAKSDDDYLYNGNPLLDNLFGATIHDLPGDADALAFAEQRARELAGRALVIPAGGSSAIGMLGYASCAEEIVHQEVAMGRYFDKVVVANGSHGTQAGLVAGFKALGHSGSKVQGYTVLSPLAEACSNTLAKAQQVAALLGSDVTASDILIDDSELGPGYGIETASMKAALSLMARRQGLLLDPVYSGKAFAGLLAAINAGKYDGQTLLFVMTGGTPGLFAYRQALA
ncbi:D-cysteine desulfhydrase family protein [Gallaecimonas mangrovi]|uniref:D-cysteine desulfhydrase family protein n=1 Tax=Gallaecimonas mangrovi TaxID=2291597 RepID=UPI001D01985A|nr:D-cysteine desulfhydrase family protein [Gallaecimonas mangrovi]